jgi:hypothetical protein
MTRWIVLCALALGCGDDDGSTTPDGNGGGDGAGSIDAAAGDGAVADGIPQGACDTLDEGACRRREDCATDTCLECSCDPVFHGCRELAAAPATCPELDCLQPSCCHTTDECKAGLCAPPGTPTGCGICFIVEDPCVDDSECDPAGTGQICQPVPCACSGEKECVAGCTGATDCGEGETCNGTTHRCEPQACAGGCPGNFRCDAGTCERMTCADDGDCPDGYCVTGSCYGALGDCRLPVP